MISTKLSTLLASVRQHRDAFAVGAGVLLPLGVAAILAPFRSTFAGTAAALVFVAVIVAVATMGTRFAGFVASLSATIWFDFFLTRPYERLTITHRVDIETAVSLFVVGMVVTELAARSRHHHRVAAEEADYVEILYGLSELATSDSPASDVVAEGARELIELLSLRDCRYDPEPSPRPVLRLEHNGQVLLAGSVWGVDDMGLPGPELELLVYSQGRTRGRFVLTPTPGLPVSFRRRVVAVAVADQVGAALAVGLRSA